MIQYDERMYKVNTIYGRGSGTEISFDTPKGETKTRKCTCCHTQFEILAQVQRASRRVYCGSLLCLFFRDKGLWKLSWTEAAKEMSAYAQRKGLEMITRPVLEESVV